MKKLLTFSVVLVCLLSSAKAQFFQHLYGNTDPELIGNGVNTNATGMGHFIVSPSYPSTGGTILATNTNVNGNVAAFNNTYALTHSSGIAIAPRNTLPIEFKNGTGFGVFGLFADPSGTVPSGIYYLELDATGAVVNTTQYDPVNITGTNFNVVEVAAVTESAAGGDFYIVGTVDPQLSSGSFWIFAMKINQAGAITWSVIYDLVNPTTSSRDWAKDVIESPYTPASVAEVVVVGQTYDNGGTSDGFFFRLDAGTGAAIVNPLIHGTTSTNEYFTCIDVANSTIGGRVGFIIGGNCDASGSQDYWVIKTGPRGRTLSFGGGPTLWSFLYDYNGGSGNRDDCTDIIERLNTFGNYEYYVAGTTDNGNIGNTDLVVVKIDDIGNPVANGQFTYGSSSNDFGSYLDQYNGTGNDGLSVFGAYDNGGNYDAYHVKAYFNGQSGCNEKLDNTSNTGGPDVLTNYSTTSYSNIIGTIIAASPSTASDINLCFNTTITGGDNSFMTPPTNGNKEAIMVSPNPMQEGNSFANLAVETTSGTAADVTIYDMLGRVYYKQNHTLATGNNNVPLDLTKANMAAGIYTITIQGANISRTVLLQVK